jgi:hypothetical protein
MGSLSYWGATGGGIGCGGRCGFGCAGSPDPETQKPREAGFLCAQRQNRTADTRIFNPLLYRLSYLGGWVGCTQAADFSWDYGRVASSRTSARRLSIGIARVCRPRRRSVFDGKWKGAHCAGSRMDHDVLEALRGGHPAWRLLAATHAPLIIGFLHRTFITPNVRTLSQPELVSRPDQRRASVRSHTGDRTRTGLHLVTREAQARQHRIALADSVRSVAPVD